MPDEPPTDIDHPTGVPSLTAAAKPRLDVVASHGLWDWLAEQRVSLAFSTYHTSKLFLVGRKPDRRLSVFERTFLHCMGLWAAPDARTLWMNSRYQLWRIDNVLAPGERQDAYDAVYVPRVGHTIGYLDVHDIAVEASGRVVFVNTKFSCLATLSDRASFRPLWRPPFLSALVPEDRCHLNGLALRDGRVRYVTAAAPTDTPEGWRGHRSDGGVVLDVQTGETLASGLSMPHSPRWHRGRLWVLNSGAGEFGYVDAERGRFVPVASCPGYLRGLTFVGDFAVVTLSLPRRRAFVGLPLDGRLRERGSDAQCGLQVIDLSTGGVVHTLRLEGIVTELYDVVALPGIERPMALGFRTDEIERMVLPDEGGGL